MSDETKEPGLYERLLKKEWSYTTGAVLIAALAMSMFAFSGIWGVSGPLMFFGGKVLTWFGVDVDKWAMFNGSMAKYKFFGNKPSITDIGLIFGALIASLLAAQWKIRGMKHWKQFAAAVVGGLAMGIGARMANGCNIGGLFSQLPQFSGAGWVFLVFVFLGAGVGGKLLPLFMPPASNTRPNRKRLTPEQQKRNRLIQILLGVLLIVFLIVVSLRVAPEFPSAPAYILLGVALGYVLQRSRFCFTAAYRDPLLTGETKLTKAVIVALALSTVAFFGFHIKAYGIDITKFDMTKVPGNPINLNLVIGAFVFGIGAVLGGGCASGTFVRIGEGYVQNMLVLPFFIAGSMLGSPILAATKDTAFAAGSKVYFPLVFGGYIPALIIQLAALLALWIIADKWEASKRGK